ncbi:hypothetical protein MMC07_006059 [Pseudocyphellaria aurata]|nr:hypothetical protein [Pseudocyphellaria aurata]
MASGRGSREVPEKGVRYTINKPSNPAFSNSSRPELSPYPWLNPRKRARNHEPTLSNDSPKETITTQEPHVDDENLVGRKRSRRADWPLKSPEEVAENQQLPGKQTKPEQKSPLPSSKKRDVASKRSSKFLEGSMHDRTSNKPPSLYTREEVAMEQYSAQERIETPAPNRYASLDGVGAFYDAGIESSKSSSMYRFGRAIVNVFKPVSSWRGFGGGKEQPTSTEKNIMQARQVQAEKEYAELKKIGFVGTQPAFQRITAVPTIRYEDTTEEARSAPFRDSGIDMNSSQSSLEPKSHGQVSQSDTGLVRPLLVPTTGRVPSSLSDRSSPRKSSVQFRKPPSFPNLRKVQCHIQLPSAKRSATPAPDSSFDYGKLNEPSSNEQSVRKQPSRKEIVKQQRLSKKVSDLENQLEIARRNLKLSLNNESIARGVEPQTGMRTFVPGALPSLPSERALKPYISPEGKNDIPTDSKQPQPGFSERPDKAQQSDSVTANPTAQLNIELQNSVKQLVPEQPNSKQTESKKRKSEPNSKQTESKKRKSDARDDEDLGHRSDEESKKRKSHAKDDELIGRRPDEGDNEAELDAAKRPNLRRSLRQSPKTRKALDADVSGKKKQNLHPRTPRNSPLKIVEPVPPLPTALQFDPAKVDQAKIMSMRSICAEKALFGRHSEDIANLRKEFPNITERQMADYLDSISEDNKVTDYTSVSHHNQPTAPVLGPPCSVSPTKTKLLEESKTADHASLSRNQPMGSVLGPACYASTTTKPFDESDPSHLMTGQERAGLSSLINEDVKTPTDVVVSAASPVRPRNLTMSKSSSTLRIKALHASAAKNEKPHPDVQKEEYEWPEDVF